MLERTPYTTWLAAALLVLALVLRQLYLRYDRRRRNDVPLVPVPVRPLHPLPDTVPTR